MYKQLYSANPPFTNGTIHREQSPRFSYSNLDSISNDHITMIYCHDSKYLAVYNNHQEPVLPVVFTSFEHRATGSYWDYLKKIVTHHTTIGEVVFELEYYGLPLYSKINLETTRRMERMRSKIIYHFTPSGLPIPYAGGNKNKRQQVLSYKARYNFKKAYVKKAIP